MGKLSNDQQTIRTLCERNAEMTRRICELSATLSAVSSRLAHWAERSARMHGKPTPADVVICEAYKLSKGGVQHD